MCNTKKKGFRVEQISRGKVVIDYDQIYTPTKLRELLSWYFKVDNKSLQGSFEGVNYHIHAKNITYLGNPWEKFKKRIQLWKDYSERVQADYDDDLVPLIIGVYHYKRTVVFVDFEAEDYLDNNSNNSAAHVQTYDLQRGLKEGIYSKVDKLGNHITVFTPETVVEFLKYKLSATGKKSPLDKINDIISDFYVSIPSQWNGVECYKYLVEVNHPKRRETEWPGFYHEALFEKYINEHSENAEVVKFQQDKSKGGLDFDLYYPEIDCYGDLKCHTIGEPEIPGNKIENMYEAIKKGPLYYVICEHTTVKDKAPDYVTLDYWNNNVRDESKRGTEVEKQKGRMKSQVTLIDYIIVQIDEYNYTLLESFQSGFLNSDGKPRGEKFSIPEKLMEEFVVRKDFIVNKGVLPENFPTDSEIKTFIINNLETTGQFLDVLKNEMIVSMKLSEEVQNVKINDKDNHLLLDLLLDRALFQLKRQGRLRQSRRGGKKFYILKS